MIAYLDAHNHLQDEWLTPYRQEIFGALSQVGIRAAIVNGTNESDWQAVADLAAEHPWVIPSYGMHPWYLHPRTNQWRESLLERVSTSKCAIGEIGLDHWKEPYDFDEQREIFVWQLALAAKRNIPVTIHCLRAWGALWEIISEHPVPECGFLLHSYGGSPEMLKGFIERGAYFSFSGYFLGARKEAKRATFEQVPLERLLAETDAPAMPLPPEWNRYPLPPTPEGESVNHPANIGVVYEGLAKIRNLPVEELANQIHQNFYRLFGSVIRN
jgi:TatD DNase family protein